MSEKIQMIHPLYSEQQRQLGVDQPDHESAGQRCCATRKAVSMKGLRSEGNYVRQGNQSEPIDWKQHDVSRSDTRIERQWTYGPVIFLVGLPLVPLVPLAPLAPLLAPLLAWFWRERALHRG